MANTSKGRVTSELSKVVGSPLTSVNGGNMANIAGVRRIKITGKVIMLIGITFAVLTWVLLYGTTDRRTHHVIGCAELSRSLWWSSLGGWLDSAGGIV